MIKQFAGTITSFLLNENIIENEEQEIYQFGTERILKNLITIFLIGIIVTIFEAWVESLFIAIGFMPLRRSAGGYHAETLLQCNILTYLIFVLNIIIIRAVIDNISIQVYMLICFITILFIFQFAPVDHKNFVFSNKRTMRAKKVARIIVLILVTTSSSFVYIQGKINLLSLSAMMGAFTASFSIFIGSIKRKGETR